MLIEKNISIAQFSNLTTQRVNINEFGLTELNNQEITNTNGGEPVTLSGAAAVAAGGAMVAGAFVVGVAIGVGVYYGVKAVTN